MFGALAARRVHGLDVGGDAEGCVADDALGHFYISEEEHAIWKYGAEPGAGTKRTLVDAAGAGVRRAETAGGTARPGPSDGSARPPGFDVRAAHDAATDFGTGRDRRGDVVEVFRVTDAHVHGDAPEAAFVVVDDEVLELGPA